MTTTDLCLWKLVSEIKTPESFDIFKRDFNAAKEYFPSFPTPSDGKLNQIYQKAIASGHVDSLKGLRISLPVRMVLGILYYDTTAVKHTKYQYRISVIKPNANTRVNLTTDTISFPFYHKFDSIVISSSSYNQTSVTVKWKSTGKNPAPLFMVYKNKYDVPVIAHGTTSRYNVNDTSFYVYTDSVLVTESGRELQYFVLPFDQFGNVGARSQVYLVPLDGFNKGEFTRNQADFSPLLSGVQITWKFSKPSTLKSVEVYRSESANSGFSKLAGLNATDTAYCDKQIWPERTYYYYIQVVAKDGKRTKQSKVMSSTIPGIGVPDKLIPPVLHKVELINEKPCLVIEVNDPTATHIRIYRGETNGLIDLPRLVKINKRKIVLFSDTSFDVKSMKGHVYAVRNEKEGTRVSTLSHEFILESVTKIGDLVCIFAFAESDRIELHWDDVIGKDDKYVSYTLARKPGAANSRSPLMVIAENLKEGYFVDKNANNGNQYTYELRVLDKTGKSSEKAFKVTANP